MEVNKDLEKYIEENIFPIYDKNEKAHGIEHIKYVIERSFEFAKEVPDVNLDIVYTVAAFHDIGHHINPKKHEIISADLMYKDENLKKFFTDDERKVIKEAIEDHRASSNHDPRSIYGKIVSTADRYNTVHSCMKSSYIYTKKNLPDLNEEEIFENCYLHLLNKFGNEGYAKFFFKDETYEAFLKEIQNLLEDKEKFIENHKKYIDELKKKGEI